MAKKKKSRSMPPIFKWFGNFYFVVGFFAMVWMLFFDQYNIPSQIEIRSRIKQLEADMQYYNQERDRLDAMNELRGNNPEELEKFAREQHWMKKPNEDLFIIVEK